MASTALSCILVESWFCRAQTMCHVRSWKKEKKKVIMIIFWAVLLIYNNKPIMFKCTFS